MAGDERLRGPSAGSWAGRVFECWLANISDLEVNSGSPGPPAMYLDRLASQSRQGRILTLVTKFKPSVRAAPRNLNPSHSRFTVLCISLRCILLLHGLWLHPCMLPFSIGNLSDD